MNVTRMNTGALELPSDGQFVPMPTRCVNDWMNEWSRRENPSKKFFWTSTWKFFWGGGRVWRVLSISVTLLTLSLYHVSSTLLLEAVRIGTAESSIFLYRKEELGQVKTRWPLDVINRIHCNPTIWVCFLFDEMQTTDRGRIRARLKIFLMINVLIESWPF